MGKKLWTVLLSTALLCTMVMSTTFAAKSMESKKVELRQKVNATLTKLYEKQPKAKKAVEQGVGYAVFVNSGYKIGFLGSAHGRGMAVNNKTRQEVYMRMSEYDLGLGIGAKEYALVFVFLNDKAWTDFTKSNWKAGAYVEATATDGVVGDEFRGAANLGKGIWVYELTTKGLTMEANIKGTNYYRDSSFYPKKEKTKK